MGRRFEKKVTTNGTVTLRHRYLYRGYLQIAAIDLQRAAQPALWYITWDPTQPVATRPLAIRKDGVWYTYGWDLTKNICEIYGQEGYIRTIYRYTPYGIVTAEGDVEQPIQWSSEYNDRYSGLVYFNYRYYNSSDARWLSRDPELEVSSLNLYTYASNVYKSIDVLGLSLVDIVRSAIPHVNGSVSISFMAVFPIAPPAVTLNATISVIGSGSFCCDRISKQQKLLFSVTISGEVSLGLGSSIKGKKYQPKGRGSKWQDARNGRFSRKPGGYDRSMGPGTEIIGNGDNFCPEEWYGGSVSYGARATFGVGYGVIIEANKTYYIDEEPTYSVTISTGSVLGARTEAFVSVAGSALLVLEI